MNSARRKTVVIIAIILSVITLIGLLYANNQTIVLRLNGFKKDRTVFASSGPLDQNRKYAVPISLTLGNRVLLGYMSQNDLGLWHMEYVSESSSDHGHITFPWSVPIERSKIVPGEPLHNFRYHYLCAGTDAVKEFGSVAELFPENITAHHFQIGHFYWIELYTYEPEALSGMNVYEILQAAGYISSN